MARSPLAPGPADEDVTHGQDVSPEDVEDEAYGDEEEEILDDGSGCRLLSRSLDTSAHASPRGARLTHGSLCHSAAVEADSFEAMVATLEEVMMDEGFNEKVGAFMQEHCHEFDEGEESLAEKLRSSRLAKQLGEERLERDALKAAVAAFADSSEDEMSSVDGSFKQHADSSDSFSLGPAGAAGSPHTILSLAQEDVT